MHSQKHFGKIMEDGKSFALALSAGQFRKFGCGLDCLPAQANAADAEKRRR